MVKEGRVDDGEDAVMPFSIFPSVQDHRTVIEGMKEGLIFTTERA